MIALHFDIMMTMTDIDIERMYLQESQQNSKWSNSKNWQMILSCALLPFKFCKNSFIEPKGGTCALSGMKPHHGL